MIEPRPTTPSSSGQSATPGTIDREIPSSLNQLYQEVILDHYRKPRNKGQLDGATHAITMNNPLCGDVIELMLRVEGGSIAEARFLGRGCSISLASASLLTGRVRGKSLEQALELSRKFTHLLHGDGALLSDDDLGDLRTLAGVSKFPVRIKCALLAWNCLEELGDGTDADGGSG
ncbi:MAG: SUF system NifU family Fe-S cluster assembly protein [Gemmatimonadales bacterium]|nr:SUF system NifU family Fe-S cluster assembly protein [Gemmatimonadales bacterium]